jgi:tRNA U34 5-methylaminomethyl-2-thiouridine-forming methyltransferase MnmC
MQRLPVITNDGSHTISIPDMQVTYHSHHGAIQESMHVFIEAGLRYVSGTLRVPDTDDIRILEMGFGTGLNAFLTLLEAESLSRAVLYTAVELYPLQQQEIVSLNYCEQLHKKNLQPVFEQLHECDWETDTRVLPHFTFKKRRGDLLGMKNLEAVHLIYYDAFAPSAQPELWTREVFEKLYDLLLPGGILVTYCSKSDVRRAMQAAGFTVTKMQGPRGKREMTRSTRTD